MSRIGRLPVELPAGVTASVSGRTVEVKGPRGVRSFTSTDDVTIRLESNVITVTPRGTSKRVRQQWGMSRTQIANCVRGVTQGFRKELEIVGVGYRAMLQNGRLVLNLGLSHDVTMEMPEGVTVTCPKQTEIVVEGIDQQQVGELAAQIRKWRRPEPYKGKGIRYKGEHIFRKEGKKK